MSFVKKDQGKPDWSLLPLRTIEAVVRILGFGAIKYSRDGWKEGVNDPAAKDRCFAALMRHLAAHQAGETVDPESGELHLAHAMCNVMFLIHFEEHGQEEAPVFLTETIGPVEFTGNEMCPTCNEWIDPVGCNCAPACVGCLPGNRGPCNPETCCLNGDSPVRHALCECQDCTELDFCCGCGYFSCRCP